MENVPHLSARTENFKPLTPLDFIGLPLEINQIR